ncbi:MAG: sporulation protein YqfD [Eubacteriales bacterium]|jgi:similar to stage IV sporulation protein
MISLRLTRWLLGYVHFKAPGGSSERFLNHCARSGINLWDIKGGRECEACVAVQNYRDLRSCARKANAKLKVLDKHGFPFATKGIRKRKGILYGAVLFFLVLYLLSIRVWSIEIVGNETIPTQQIRMELTRQGITTGTLKSRVRPLELQQKLMLKFPKISWLSVNTRGCCVEIHLQEKIDRPPIVEKEKQNFCNIKASRTGQIVSMEVYTGTSQVKEGDAVVEGQLLISGVVENNMGEVALKHAGGKVIAETSHNFTTEVNLRQTVKKPTGKTVTRRSFSLFGARIPLTFAGKPDASYRAEGVHTDVKLMNSVLPLSLYEETWTQETMQTVTLTKEQGVAQAQKMIQKKIKEELKDAKIITSSATEKITGTRLVYALFIKCEENIAQESEILTE